jgi:hypothetical protein
MRARLTLAAGTAALALAGSVFAAVPASAATCTPPPGGGCADTTVSFTLTGGALSITAPSTATLTPGGNLGTVGNAVTGSLTGSKVTDNRGALLNTATVKVTSTDFDYTGDSDANNDGVNDGLIPATAATATTAAPSATTGTATVGTPVVNTSGDLKAGMNILTVVSVGSGSATYSPSITVTLPANAVASQTYSGTVTQTVS